MQLFFCSVRTALLFGPAEILEAEAVEDSRMRIRARWQGAPEVLFDEWEGYAVCVPEKQAIWGLARPQLEEEEVVAEFEFQPQPMPPEAQKIFEKPPRKKKTGG